MNIYLDIDGVLLKKHGGPADNVLDFLEYITENFDCYWLTTHCRNGGNNAVEYLSDKLPKESIKYLEKIKPAYWDMLKTEGINFYEDFVWIDDYIMEAEERYLKYVGCYDNFLKVEDGNIKNLIKEIENIKNKRELELEALFEQAKYIASINNELSATKIQRRMHVDYSTSQGLRDLLLKNGVLQVEKSGQDKRYIVQKSMLTKDECERLELKYKDELYEKRDDLYNDAKELTQKFDSISIPCLQRNLQIGYARAANIFDQLTEDGVLEESKGIRPRKVLKK